MDKGILWRAGLVLGFALIIWFGYSLSQDMRDGAAAQQGKRYDQAIAIYEPIAEKGSWIPFWNPQTRAQQEIGHIHAFRDDGQDRMDEAIKWWERASKGGNVVAQFALGQAYYQGDDVEQDLEKAYTWVMVSANPKSKSQRRYQKQASAYQQELTDAQMASATKAIDACLSSGYVDCPY
jgi:TPR repeat protein